MVYKVNTERDKIASLMIKMYSNGNIPSSHLILY